MDVTMLPLTLILALAGSVVGQWSEIGHGVGYQQFGAGRNVFIGYAGCTVRNQLSRHWVARLMDKSPLQSTHSVGHAYAVKGPDDCSYNANEIQNSLLINHLLEGNFDHIIIAAHSSGAFVAHELLHQLFDQGFDPSGQTVGKITYFNLDGGGGLSWNAYQNLRAVRYVWVRSGSIESMNAPTMRALAGPGESMMLDGSQSQCMNGRCLHSNVIIKRPWDPWNFDLERDYGLFSVGDREVQFEYINRMP